MNSKKESGLYIHIPFCAVKCPYCDFYSIADESLYAAWICALEKEMSHYAPFMNRFSTLYIGGGTPTVLNERFLEALIESVHRHFSFPDHAEKTIEANPNDLTKEKVLLLRSLGFNRISLGVQSFDENILAILGRRHTVSEAIEAMRFIRESGFLNLNIDLMYAVPGQTPLIWEETLRQAITFNPEHIACYQFTIKQGTPFWDMKQSGKILPQNDEEVEKLFFTTSETLTGKGFIHYEVSNFARTEQHIAVHNRNYWLHKPYLGLGPSAHSFSGDRRWWNVASVKQYVGMLEEGSVPVGGEESISDEELRLEELFLGFRTRTGVDLSTLEKCEGFESVLPQLLESHFAELNGSRLTPTLKGYLVADSIPILFA